MTSARWIATEAHAWSSVTYRPFVGDTRGRGVMKSIAAPIVGGVITSTFYVLIQVPVFFAVMKERALCAGTLTAKTCAE